MAILFLFNRKAGLQLQYLRLKSGKPAGQISDFWRFSWRDAQARQKRWEAFLLFPMLYAVVMDDERDDLLTIKRAIKRVHILIYFSLIILVILGIYSEKVFGPTA